MTLGLALIIVRSSRSLNVTRLDSRRHNEKSTATRSRRLAGKMTPEEFTDYLKQDYRRTTKVATDLNLPKE